MKHTAIFIISGIILAALVICALGVGVAASSTPTIWYKNIPATYSAKGTLNAFDYTELNKQITEIEPTDRNEILALSKGQVMSMSTQELLVTCLDYPLFGDIVFYDNLVTGFESVAKKYNGLQTLMECEDIGDVLCEFYTQIELDKVLSTDEFSLLRFDYLTLIIADDRVVEKISSENRKVIFNQCVQNCKDMYSEYKGELDYIQTARLAGKILYLENTKFAELAKSSEVIQKFLNTGTVGEYSAEEWEQIVQCVLEYV